MDKWGPIVGVVLGTGGIGSLLVIFFVPAPKRYDAAQEQAAQRIIDIQARLQKVEGDLKVVQDNLSDETKERIFSNRQRDAVANAYDQTADSLRLSAEMHQNKQVPPDSLLKRWLGTKPSSEILEELIHDEKHV